MEGFQGTIDIYLASAGTGKTKTLLDIIEGYLVKGVPIERMALVTFTRKGAEVLRLRIAERFGLPLKRLTNVRTIHSLAFRGCNASRDTMMDYRKYKDFGEKAGYNFSHLGLDVTEGVNWSEMKDQQLVAIEQLYRNNKPYCEQIMDNKVDYGRLSQYIELYTRYKHTFHYQDFTDLLENYLTQEYTEDVDIVCLDEMQDSSLLQWQLVFQAFKNAKHIYVAADIKQSIFTYAGASPSTVMSLRGTQHILNMSYRVPSNILKFAQNIVNEMTLTDHSNCEATQEGGDVMHITGMEEFTSLYTSKKSYFFLARNKKFFQIFESWCRELGIPYKIKGVPIFTATDKLEFRAGKTQDWNPDKLAFAKYCYSNGTFYPEPNIDINTIHTVKGDEADVVLLLSDISKNVSIQLDMDEDSEHRVFYVATTRAKQQLIIVEPQTSLYYPYIV